MRKLPNVRNRVVFDVDDVIVNFTDHVIELVEHELGIKLDRKNKTEFDIAKAYNMPQIDRIWHDAVERGGFVSSMKPNEGAINAINEIRSLGFDVYALTHTPLLRNWHFERSNWLIEHVGIQYDWQVHTGAKYGYGAAFFVDDNLENLKLHSVEHPDTVRIVFDQEWNRDIGVERSYGFKRALSWCDVVNIIENW